MSIPKMTIHDPVEPTRDRLVELMQDRTLFITGGTGFVGKILIEKILRVADIKKIFVLIRTKKGKSAAERFAQVFNEPIFDKLKKTKGEGVLKKIHVIPGDVSEVDLAISEEDRKILTEETEFIYHCAATIRFDEDLKPAVLLNVRGTKYILELAKQCKKLLTFVYLSTAYCHLNERILYEKAYPPPAEPDAIIKMCELMDNKAINAVAPKILNGIPNSYAFTKALGEALVAREKGKLPVAILRPSIIMPVLQEPIPGWTDNINGPMGLLIAAGKGVLRTMYCKSDAYADYVPVDIVANTILICSLDHLIYESNRWIYNITSSAEYKMTHGEIIEVGRKTVEKIPFNGIFWYPGGSMKSSRFIHEISFFLFQWLPAVVVDLLLICLGYKPVLKRVQRRILKGYEVFEYYTNRQWDFNNDASMAARKYMSDLERERYKVDGFDVKYEDYFYNCTLAARRYILNEPDETIPAAKRHFKIMFYVDKICKTLIVLGFLYLLYKYIFANIFS